MYKSLLLITIFFLLSACSSNVSEVNNEKPASFTVEPSTSESMVVTEPVPLENAVVADPAPLESMVVTEPVPLYDYMNKDPVAPNNDKYCTELSQKVQELKGKPQRHYAAQKRYEAECKF